MQAAPKFECNLTFIGTRLSDAFIGPNSIKKLGMLWDGMQNQSCSDISARSTFQRLLLHSNVKNIVTLFRVHTIVQA